MNITHKNTYNTFFLRLGFKMTRVEVELVQLKKKKKGEKKEKGASMASMRKEEKDK